MNRKSVISALEKYRILLIKPPANNQNFHSYFIDRLSTAFHKQGVNTLVLDANRPSFTKDLIESTHAGGLVHLGLCYYDLSLSSYAGQTASIFDELNIPNFAIIGDHLYSSFLQTALEKCTPATNFVCRIEDTFKEMKIIKPLCKKLHHIRPYTLADYEIANNSKSFGERSIDLFLPISLAKTNVSISEYLSNFKGNPKLHAFVDTLYQDMKKNDDIYVIDKFITIFKDQFKSPYQFSTPWNQNDRVFLQILSTLDFIVRTESRIAILQSLQNLPKHIKIAITAPDGPKTHPNIEYIGYKDIRDVQKIYADAKFVLDIIPTYKNSIQERITMGGAFGCIPITQKKQEVEKYFQDGQSIIYSNDYYTVPPEPFEVSIQEGQKISTNVKDIIQKSFSLEDNCVDYLKLMAASMDS